MMRPKIRATLDVHRNESTGSLLLLLLEADKMLLGVKAKQDFLILWNVLLYLYSFLHTGTSTLDVRIFGTAGRPARKMSDF